MKQIGRAYDIPGADYENELVEALKKEGWWVKKDTDHQGLWRIGEGRNKREVGYIFEEWMAVSLYNEGLENAALQFERFMERYRSGPLSGESEDGK